VVAAVVRSCATLVASPRLRLRAATESDPPGGTGTPGSPMILGAVKQVNDGAANIA
jgi:hypothetical protein